MCIYMLHLRFLCQDKCFPEFHGSYDIPDVTIILSYDTGKDRDKTFVW